MSEDILMDKDLEAVISAAKEEEPKKKKISKGLVSAAEEAALDANWKRFQKKMLDNNMWGYDKKGILAVQGEMQRLSTKIGIYARVPIHCKGEKCPYSESCILFQNDLAPEGQPCPTEVAQVQQKYLKYIEEFEMDEQDISTTDESLIEEIIKMEIMMARCTALMSKEVSPIQMIIAGVTEDGEKYYNPEVSKATEAYERFSKIRNNDYNLLMATRKDKSKFKKEEREQKTIQDVLDQISNVKDIYEIEQRPVGAEAIINSGQRKKSA